jgi:hypothetical protein
MTEEYFSRILKVKLIEIQIQIQIDDWIELIEKFF